MVENKRVFFCDVDFLYTDKAEEYEEYEGGAVYVFVKAFDVREALSMLLEDMKNKDIQPKEIVSIQPYNLKQEWANEEERKQYLYLYAACDKVEPIVYDDFIVYKRVVAGLS